MSPKFDPTDPQFILIVAALLILCIGIGILTIIGMIFTFRKMGYSNAWWLIIPVLNMVFLLQVAERPVWWLILVFIPCLGPIVSVILQWEVSMIVAKAYGRGVGTALGLFFLGFIFYPILGFGGQVEPPPPMV